MNKTRPMAFVTASGKVELLDRPLPALGAHEVLVRVRAVTLCGSDLHIFRGLHPAAPLPVSVGHEIAGEVIEAGAAVNSLQVGEHVVVEPVIACGECHFCQRGSYHLCTQISFQYRRGQGGLTTHFIVHERWAHKLPEGLSFEAGALLEPVAVTVHAVQKAAPRLGESAAVFGAGAIGLLTLQLLRLASGGPVYVVDVNPARLAAAHQLGAAAVLNNRQVDAVQEIRSLTGDLGADMAFEAAGLNLTLLQALQVLRKGGRAILVGLYEKPEINLPANIFVQREITLHGSQGYNWDFQTAITLAGQQRLQLAELISHRFSLQDVQQAFDTLADPNSGAVKIAVHIPET